MAHCLVGLLQTDSGVAIGAQKIPALRDYRTEGRHPVSQLKYPQARFGIRIGFALSPGLPLPPTLERQRALPSEHQELISRIVGNSHLGITSHLLVIHPQSRMAHVAKAAYTTGDRGPALTRHCTQGCPYDTKGNPRSPCDPSAFRDDFLRSLRWRFVWRNAAERRGASSSFRWNT